MSEKYLYIVLTRTSTILSSLIHVIKEDEFTHAAISLDGDLEHMFSFGRRYVNNPFIGCFRQERMDEGVYGRHKELPGLILRLHVTEFEYDKMREMIEEFSNNNHRYGYNYAGLWGGLFGISIYSENRFLCSEFVYYALHQCGICDFNRHRSLVRPQDLLNINGEILYKGDLKQYTYCRKLQASLNTI